MTFIWPSMLLLLFGIPPLVSAYIWMQQRRAHLTARFGNSSSPQAAPNRRLRIRRHVPSFLFLIALVVLIFALARPQTMVSLPRLEGTVILAFDVSGSMAADDLAPTRLEAAKAAAREFVMNQPTSVLIGVVSFSEGGFATQPPTDDQEAVLAALNRLTIQRGTSVGRGIEAALNVIAAGTDGPLTLSVEDPNNPPPTPTPVPEGEYKPAVIVLLTDGENNQNPDPLEFAQQAKDRGIRIYTVGIGSVEGATLEIEGFRISSRLDEPALQQIAGLTGGTYYNAQNEEDLRAIYDNLNPEFAFKEQDIEVTSLFAGAGILVLMAGAALSLIWLGRLP